jgi:hypothetical protein
MQMQCAAMVCWLNETFQQQNGFCVFAIRTVDGGCLAKTKQTPLIYYFLIV